MTKLYGFCDLFFYLLWLTWSPIVCSEPRSSSPEGVGAKHGSEDITKRENPSSPKTFFHYRKEVFRFNRNCQWKFFKPLGKHQLLLFQSLCWQNHQSQEQHDPFVVVFQKKRQVVHVFLCPLCSLLLCACIVELHSWQVCEISAPALFFLTVIFATDVDMNMPPVCGAHLFSFKRRAVSCWRRSNRSRGVTARPEATQKCAFLELPSHSLGIRTAVQRRLDSKTNSFGNICYICIPNIQKSLHDVLIWVDRVSFFILRASCVFLSYLAVFVLTYLVDTQDG